MELLKRAGLLGLMLCVIISPLSARSATSGTPTKKLDLFHYHDKGDIELRVSNYGFFGSGNDIDPRWPSLEYPAGSDIDYLYQGALWFGAKKYRRDAQGNKYYWKNWEGGAPDYEAGVISSSTPHYLDSLQYDYTLRPDGPVAVLDTLVSVGFDGDKSLNELLPAYNPLELKYLNNNTSGNFVEDQYDIFTGYDEVIEASIRTQRRGVDDDGDGHIDEDPAGFGFPLRSESLPEEFAMATGLTIENANRVPEFATAIRKPENLEIWFPLGFVDLSYTGPGTEDALLSKANDDDGDGLMDEDGYPVSEQDFIGYFYDYSPFGNLSERDWGQSRNSSDHFPLNIKVRQMSYQWSFGYIKNLCYIEFNVTNMNPVDTLFDCAMGIYMDSDVGPQGWDDNDRSSDDISGYVPGEGYEFAWTKDADTDNGLTTAYLGARVCTPDPEQLEFACWTWKVGDGPDDAHPRDEKPADKKTSNEKYWLLTGKNPRSETHRQPIYDLKNPAYDAPDEGEDTRFLFAFYGRQDETINGVQNPENEDVWNLLPGKTMKIVVALFPGETLEDLKGTAIWAKDIYGEAQVLQNVVLPDIYPHYNPPEPPPNPESYIEMSPDGSRIDVFWNNKSEFAVDYMLVPKGEAGWRINDDYDVDSKFSNSSDPDLPDAFKIDQDENSPNYNVNEQALVNPFTAYRLRHDFQGYNLWGRTGSTSAEAWELKGKWDKVETERDHLDYDIAMGVTTQNGIVNKNYGGYEGIDYGLPQPKHYTNDADEIAEMNFGEYYQLNEYYILEKISDIAARKNGDHTVYGVPIYDYSKTYQSFLADHPNYIEPGAGEVLSSSRVEDEALYFKNPGISKEAYLALYEDKMIPLMGHLGQSVLNDDDPNIVEKEISNLREERLARRFYKATINHPIKGLHYYVSVNSYDRGMPDKNLKYLESGRDENIKTVFPGPTAKENMNDIYVVPNPYKGSSKFDGRFDNDEKGDKSRRIWFVNLPEKCTIKIYTLAGDLVQTLEHNGAEDQPVIELGASTGVQASGIHPWNLLTRNNQITASGVYLFSVKNKRNDDIKVGKFVIIK